LDQSFISNPSKPVLWFELVLVFIGLPLVFYFELLPVPKLPALVIFTVYTLVLLWLDRSYANHLFIKWSVTRSQFNTLLLRFGLFSVVTLLSAWFLIPDQFLIIPRERPQLWVIIMIFYPLISALPQELIYRSFFFHRYQKLFESGLMMIGMSAFLFGFLHIIYDNWVAVISTFLGGWLFSITYRKSNSLLLVSLEHALYGCIIFTSGFGSYFYEAFGS